MLTIDTPTQADFEALVAKDRHVPANWVHRCIGLEEYLVARDGGRITGFLRFSMFWGTIPFMDMIVVDGEERGKGIGQAMFSTWEANMRKKGARVLTTSAMSDEPKALDWHRRNGFVESGALTFGVMQETPEQFMVKNL